MAAYMLAVGRVVNGAVVITAPTLEERLDAAIEHASRQIERNREVLAMHADLDELISGQRDPLTRLPAPPFYVEGEEPWDEQPGYAESTQPYLY